MNDGERPLSVLIAAMGGEGGGVLANWLIEAATQAGLHVQATSIPGVAQRTGATTYYLELLSRVAAGKTPVLGLYPKPGGLDLIVASEPLEAGRMMQNGFVAPDRTTLISSHHRVYAIDERTAMTDGRYDVGRILAAAEELSARFIAFDMAALADREGAVISAVMLGAIAGAGVLPIDDGIYEGAIEAEGKAVERNLAAFRAAAGVARAGPEAPPPTTLESQPAPAPEPTSIGDLPPAVAEIVAIGLPRLTDYQDAAYAESYRGRIDALWQAERAAGGDGAVSAEAARLLALWMSYEDVIRVAQAKTRAGRSEAVRAEVQAPAGQPVAVTEFLKPGLDEFCSILPAGLARWILERAKRGGWHDRVSLPLKLRSSTVSGFALLRLMAGLRRWRRKGLRFAEEQRAIEAWLARARRAIDLDRDLAAEIIACAGLIKGYSTTRARGQERYDGLMASLVDPTLAGEMAAAPAAAALRRARLAARSDPKGDVFAASLAPVGPAAGTAVLAAE